MKLFLPLLLFPFLLLAAHGQNLVPNPSFEEFIMCPDAGSQIELAEGWSSFRETPDYFNECSSDNFSSVPYNSWGLQEAYSGTAYAGIQTYFTSNFREYIGTELTSPLEIGTKYYVQMKVATAKGGYAGANCAIDKLGIKLSTIEYDNSSPALIDNFAHINTNYFITDTVNWILVSDSLIADSSYSHLIIGNFYIDANTDTVRFFSDYCRAYYFIEDVCISTDVSKCSFNVSVNSLNSNDRVVVFPNPTHGHVNIGYAAARHAEVYSSTGVKQLGFELNGNFEQRIDVSELDNGLYYLKLYSGGNSTYTIKLMINH